MRASEEIARQLCRDAGFNPDDVVRTRRPEAPGGIVLDIAVPPTQMRWREYLAEAVDQISGGECN